MAWHEAPSNDPSANMELYERKSWTIKYGSDIYDMFEDENEKLFPFNNTFNPLAIPQKVT